MYASELEFKMMQDWLGKHDVRLLNVTRDNARSRDLLISILRNVAEERVLLVSTNDLHYRWVSVSFRGRVRVQRRGRRDLSRRQGHAADPLDHRSGGRLGVVECQGCRRLRGRGPASPGQAGEPVEKDAASRRPRAASAGDDVAHAQEGPRPVRMLRTLLPTAARKPSANVARKGAGA